MRSSAIRFVFILRHFLINIHFIGNGDLFQNGFIGCEKNCLKHFQFRIISFRRRSISYFSIEWWIVTGENIATRLSDFAFEYQSTIQRYFHILHTTSRIDSTFIVILCKDRESNEPMKRRRIVPHPNANQRNFNTLFKSDGNEVFTTCRKRC